MSSLSSSDDEFCDPESAVHDQLPGIDDVKISSSAANNHVGGQSSGGTRNRSKYWLLLVVIGCLFLAGGVVGIIAAVSSLSAGNTAFDSNELRPTNTGGGESVVPEKPIYTPPVIQQGGNDNNNNIQPPPAVSTIPPAPKEEDNATPSPPAPETEPPIPIADEERFNYLVEKLVQKQVSTKEQLTTEGTPQHTAATWIANIDERKVSLQLQDDILFQRYALAVFFHTMNGPNWTNKLKFLTNDSECNWTATMWGSKVGVTCDANGRVQQLGFRKY